MDNAPDRVHWIDSVRACGVTLVILIHCTDAVFQDAGITQSAWWATNWYQSFSVVAVGLFVMLSGFLGTLHKRQDKNTKSIGVKLIRIGGPFLFWTVAYGLYFRLTGQDDGELLGFTLNALTGDVASHLWFVYMFLGIMALSPLLDRLVACLHWLWTTSVIIIWFVIMSTAVLRYEFTGFELVSDFLLAPLYVGYYLTGGLLAKQVRRPPGFMAICCLVIYLSAGIGTALLTYHYTMQNHGWLYPYFYFYLSPNAVIMTVSAFLVLWFLVTSSSTHTLTFKWLLARMSCIAKYSYAIYLGHMLVLDSLILILGGAPSLNNTIHPYVGIPVLASAVLLATLTAILFATRLNHYRIVLFSAYQFNLHSMLYIQRVAIRNGSSRLFSTSNWDRPV